MFCDEGTEVWWENLSDRVVSDWEEEARVQGVKDPLGLDVLLTLDDLGLSDLVDRSISDDVGDSLVRDLDIFSVSEPGDDGTVSEGDELNTRLGDLSGDPESESFEQLLVLGLLLQFLNLFISLETLINQEFLRFSIILSLVTELESLVGEIVVGFDVVNLFGWVLPALLLVETIVNEFHENEVELQECEHDPVVDVHREISGKLVRLDPGDCLSLNLRLVVDSLD